MLIDISRRIWVDSGGLDLAWRRGWRDFPACSWDPACSTSCGDDDLSL